MTIKKSLTPAQVKESFDNLLGTLSEEELLEQEIRLLSFRFLSAIETAMDEQKISKKTLAEKVNTSASYITQLFRGDRLPNFSILAKIQKALDIQFDIQVKTLEAVAPKRDRVIRNAQRLGL